jgi:hypothetical protein
VISKPGKSFMVEISTGPPVVERVRTGYVHALVPHGAKRILQRQLRLVVAEHPTVTLLLQHRK